jgi:hypothetical protein
MNTTTPKRRASASPFANLLPVSPLNTYLTKNFTEQRKRPLEHRLSIQTTYSVNLGDNESIEETLLCSVNINYGTLNQETGKIDLNMVVTHEVTKNTSLEVTYTGDITLNKHDNWSVDRLFMKADVENSNGHLLERLEQTQDNQAHNIRNYFFKKDPKTEKYGPAHADRSYKGRNMLSFLRKESISRITAASKQSSKKTKE